MAIALTVSGLDPSTGGSSSGTIPIREAAAFVLLPSAGDPGLDSSRFGSRPESDLERLKLDCLVALRFAFASDERDRQAPTAEWLLSSRAFLKSWLGRFADSGQPGENDFAAFVFNGRVGLDEVRDLFGHKALATYTSMDSFAIPDLPGWLAISEKYMGVPPGTWVLPFRLTLASLREWRLFESNASSQGN